MSERILSLALVLGLGLGLGACIAPTQPPPGATGKEIFELQLCSNCHGKAGIGGSRGPALRGLTDHWTEVSLARFLADVESFERDDTRVRALASAYSGDMRSYANLNEDERIQLARYLLAL